MFGEVVCSFPATSPREGGVGGDAGLAAVGGLAGGQATLKVSTCLYVNLH